ETGKLLSDGRRLLYAGPGRHGPIDARKGYADAQGERTMHVLIRKRKIARRELMAVLAASPVLASQAARALEPGVRQGKLKQSVMPQVWGDLDLDIQERCEIL